MIVYATRTDTGGGHPDNEGPARDAAGEGRARYRTVSLLVTPGDDGPVPR